MQVDADLRELMFTALRIEKNRVCEDLEEYGCALVIYATPSGRSFQEVSFTDEESKIEAYSAVRARELGAYAIYHGQRCPRKCRALCF